MSLQVLHKGGRPALLTVSELLLYPAVLIDIAPMSFMHFAFSAFARIEYPSREHEYEARWTARGHKITTVS